MIELLFYSLIGGFFSLIGGFLLLWKSEIAYRLISPLISFGAGAFLAAALLDILPEALEMYAEPQPILAATVFGFVLFFVLERIIMRFFRFHRLNGNSEHSEHTESLPLLLISGDSFHNFLDGIVIAIAYVANPTLGLPTALAIAAHELPQEIGDFSVLLHLKWNKIKIISINILQSLLTIPGVFLGFYVGNTIEPILPYLLGITAGIFLYITASDLIPELHHRSGHKQLFSIILPFIGSILLIWQLSRMAHVE